MTTISGHNIVVQQSGVAHELTHQTAVPKPSPEQAAILQEATQTVKNSTVQEFEESEKLKFKKEKDNQILQQKEEEERKKRQKQEELELDPEATGKLLDTIV